VKNWWTGLSRRERIATVSAAALVLLTLLYLLGIEPAWRTRARLAADLPRLHAEASQVDAFAAEAKKLRARTRSLESPEQTRAALAKLLAEKNIAAAPLREAEGGSLIVSVRRAEAASFLAWLKDASTELPLRIATARIARVAPGLVDAEVTLTPAGQK